MSEYHTKCEALRQQLVLIKTVTLSREERGRALAVARELATELGFNLGGYNSNEFARDLPFEV